MVFIKFFFNLFFLNYLLWGKILNINKSQMKTYLKKTLINYDPDEKNFNVPIKSSQYLKIQ